MPGTSQYAHGAVRLDGLNLHTHDPWLSGKPHWTDTALGKAGIEIVARATLGSFFFAWTENSKGMASMSRYAREGFRNDPGSRTWMQWPAYLIDVTLGDAIARGMRKAGRNPDDFLKFRELRQMGHGQFGRSLGAEMTVVTASFASMSLGTGIARTAINSVLNPRTRSSWLKDGRFEVGHAAKRFLKESWTIVTKNAGEDAGVALPYVIFMRWWRNFVNVLFPGFKYSSDNVDNGGGVVLNDEVKVVGHYALAGALDLQGRFTVYNVFTQFYRDIYDRVGAKLLSWKDHGFKLSAPEWLQDPASIPRRSWNATGNLLRYFTISTVRSLIQMTPSVMLFWPFRVPQGKKVGLAVHPIHGPLTYKGVDGGDKLYLVRADQRIEPEAGVDPYTKDFNGPLFWSDGTPAIARDPDGREVGPRVPFRDRRHGDFEPYGFSKPGRRLAHSSVAKASDWIGGIMDRSARWSPVQSVMRPVWGWLGVSNPDRHIGTQVDAAWAYAPYMAMKGFTRDVYVNDQMNLSIGRALDGFLALNWKEFREGVGEIWRTCMRLPLENPVSQTQLVRQHLHNPRDRSPIPANWSPEKHREILDDPMPSGEHIVGLINTDRGRSYLNRVAREPSAESARWADAMLADVTREKNRKEKPAKGPAEWTGRTAGSENAELAPAGVA